MELNLRELRVRAGLSLKESSSQVGLTYRQMVNAEQRGLQMKFRDTVFPQLAKLYHVSLEEIRISNMITSGVDLDMRLTNSDDYLESVDLRKIFANLYNFSQPITLPLLKELLKREHVVGDLVVLDYKATMKSILDENSDSKPEPPS